MQLKRSNTQHTTHSIQHTGEPAGEMAKGMEERTGLWWSEKFFKSHLLLVLFSLNNPITFFSSLFFSAFFFSFRSILHGLHDLTPLELVLRA